MKRVLLVILIIALIFCTACVKAKQVDTVESQKTERVSEPSVEIQPAATPDATEPLNIDTPKPTVTDKVWPELDWAESGEYIPDIIQEEEFASRSYVSLYEDEKYVYYLRSVVHDLIYINKKNGEIKTISKNCCEFTVHKGNVFYANEDGFGDEAAFYSYIEVYNVKTGTNKSLIKIEESIYGLACYKDKLFFTCTPNFELEEQGLVLFSANLDGTEIKKIGDDVDSFCIYQDDIYMITTGDLGYLHKYDFDNNIFKKIYTGALSCGYLDFSQNRIFGYEHKETRFRTSDILAYDISTGETKEYPPYISNIVAGQYIIFRQEDEINHSILKAYDFLAEKGYTLLDITETFAEYDRIHIETTPENIYLCIYKPMGLEIYCVLIQNGKVNLEKLISVINEEQSQK